jgi:hypothetical protein
VREGDSPKSQEKRKMESCLRCLSQKRRISLYCLCSLFLSPGEPSAFPFIGSIGGRGIPKTLRWCLRGEGSASTIEVVVTTCPGNGQPSLGCCGDVGDGTVKDPRSCDERAIPCGRRADVIPWLTGGGRGRVRT